MKKLSNSFGKMLGSGILNPGKIPIAEEKQSTGAGNMGRLPAVNVPTLEELKKRFPSILIWKVVAHLMKLSKEVGSKQNILAYNLQVLFEKRKKISI